jgi:hypothetical protein
MKPISELWYSCRRCGKVDLCSACVKSTISLAKVKMDDHEHDMIEQRNEVKAAKTEVVPAVPDHQDVPREAPSRCNIM